MTEKDYKKMYRTELKAITDGLKADAGDDVVASVAIDNASHDMYMCVLRVCKTLKKRKAFSEDKPFRLPNSRKSTNSLSDP